MGGLIPLALGVAAGVLALRFAALAAYLGAMSHGRLGAADFALFVGKAFALAAAAAAMLPLRRWSRRDAGWTLGALGLVVLALAWRPPEGATRTNAFGLASFAANGVEEKEYSRSANKDAYPVCRFRSNSLGYRDEEPSRPARKGARRVLVVGDSYVWGDGIPDNEESLPYLLRAELERRAPGRFVVMSAAYPGLGLYGYARSIDALYGAYQPDAVVVGYLGENDHDPFDPQFLLDHLPRGPWLRNLVLNLGAPQQVHEASIRSYAPLWTGAPNKERFAALTRDLAARAAERGYRLLFLSYFGHPPLPAGVEALELPEELRYPGRASDLWYAKDFHPKTKLNRILSKTLAMTLEKGA